MDEKRISHNRQSNRLQGYDYSSPGLYFVTIVSYQRLPVFGEVISGEIQLNQIGEIVELCWQDIPLHFNFVAIDAFVIMPNHLHGIINIDEHHFISNDQNTKPKGTPSQSLGAIIGSFKSAATKQVHRLGLTSQKRIWQRNYYEHVIRDDEDYQRIVEYIVFNPMKWEEDQEYVPIPCSV